MVKLWAESSSVLYRAGVLVAQTGHMRAGTISILAAAALLGTQAGSSAQVQLAFSHIS